MAAVRSLVLGFLAVGILSTSLHAEPIILGNWNGWFAGTTNSAAPFATAPASSVFVAPVVPAPAPSQAVPAAPAAIPVSSPVTTVTPPVNTTVAAAPPTITAAPATPVSTGPVDAYINLGAGPYPQSSTITTGGAQAWYNSSAITSLFGGTPTAAQQQSFDAAILARVQQTFAQSGINVTLTDNPNVSALHTLSLVSNTVSTLLPSAIGMTNVGGNGFSFIDNIAGSASNLNQVEWITAHNISHELMLAFGVGENYDQTGNYIDARNANWNMMVDPSSTFSSGAAQAINQALASQTSIALNYANEAQVITEAQVLTPEPATILTWTLTALAAGFTQRRRLSTRAAA